MFEIHVKGLVEVERAAIGFQRDLKNRQKPLRQIREKQTQRWMQNFTSEGGLYGGWAALAPATVATRGNSGPILVRSGSLMSWVNTQSKEGQISADAINWNFSWSGGRDPSVAVLHSEGFFNRQAGRSVPARVIWDMNADDQENAIKIMEEYVDEIIHKYFS